jgi:hypothetical protein
MSVKETRRVLIYGNSVILGSIGASLRRRPQLEVMMCEPLHGDLQPIEALDPDVVLFDVASTPAEALFPLLESRSSMVLIGVSPDVNLVKVWSGRQLREMSLVELTEIITGEKRALD